jgi:hypothetical protein
MCPNLTAFWSSPSDCAISRSSVAHGMRCRNDLLPGSPGGVQRLTSSSSVIERKIATVSLKLGSRSFPAQENSPGGRRNLAGLRVLCALTGYFVATFCTPSSYSLAKPWWNS